jgi:type IV pilus assembly protein PilE
MTTSRGFTLIELMIVLVIAAILAAVAIPSYRDSVIKGNRRAAQSAMMDIVNRQQEFFVANRTYATTAQIAICQNPPPEVSAHYTCAITLDAGPPPGFTVTMTAIDGQTRDGNISVDSVGRKTPENKWK